MLREQADWPSDADAPLEIRLFGELELARRGYETATFETRKARAILSRLVLKRDKPHFRDELAECFWPESEPGQSRAALRTELWRIRLVLARLGLNPRHYLEAGIDTIRFRPRGPILVDIEMFETALETPADCDKLLALYRADLLEGEYGDWCQFDREHYRSLFIDALEAAMTRAMGVRDFVAALDLGNRLVSLDPLAEHIHRKVIECHTARGNRSAALRQYVRCASLLERELKVSPMPETRALVEEIRMGEVVPVDAFFPHTDEAVRRLARSALHEAARQLDDALIARQPSQG